MKFGELLRNGLAAKKITQTLLAKEVGISRIQLNRYVNDAAVPKLETAASLAKILGFSLDLVQFT